jgi:hypothetical protein
METLYMESGTLQLMEFILVEAQNLAILIQWKINQMKNE